MRGGWGWRCSWSTATGSTIVPAGGLTPRASWYMADARPRIDPHVDVSSELGIALNSVYDTSSTALPRAVPPMLAESWTSPDSGLYLPSAPWHRFHDDTPSTLPPSSALDRVTDQLPAHVRR